MQDLILLDIRKRAYSAGLVSGIALDNEISSEHTMFMP